MQLHSKVSTIFRKLFELKMIKFCFGLLSRYQGHILYQITAIVIWTHMIDFDFSRKWLISLFSYRPIPITTDISDFHISQYRYRYINSTCHIGRYKTVLWFRLKSGIHTTLIKGEFPCHLWLFTHFLSSLKLAFFRPKTYCLVLYKKV